MSTVRKVLSVCEAGAPLSEWLTEARRGGRALLILGEQGAGRSTILRELHRLAVAQGVTVAETWCRGDAAEPPHLPLMHLLESLAYDAGEPAAPLQDALDKWSQNPQAWHLASRLIYPLRELARRQPILLLIDDLHHAHENLQRIIVNWLIALRMEPIGLAMTAATPHKSQLLRELEQVIGERAAGEVWSLRMLTREETAQRVRTMLGNPPDADALLAEYGAPLLIRLLQTPATPPRRSRGWDLYMQLLGETALHYRAATMTARMWHSPRARALCASLAMQEGAPVDAFTLMEWHFPHLDADRARVNLQTTISAARRSLRKAFGESAGDWIHYENGVYRWSPPCAWRLDVQEFESIASDALGIAQPDQQLERLNEAIRLYAGDLLPEFADEAWCSVAHQRMRVLLVECLLARAQRYYVRGEYADAAADCERILQIDPTDEGALCLLLQIYAAQGHKAEATRLFQHTQQHARERFGHALAPTTVETFQRLFG